MEAHVSNKLDIDNTMKIVKFASVTNGTQFLEKEEPLLKILVEKLSYEGYLQLQVVIASLKVLPYFVLKKRVAWLFKSIRFSGKGSQV